ncbi:MAG: DUF4199 domain-containing protein [Ignavibacteriaceae bacterium]
METKKILPSLVCGFGAAVLTTVPVLKNIGCCLIVPVAAFLSLFLDNRINKSLPPIDFKKAIAFGILTGIFAAFFSTLFDVLITFISHTNDYIDALPQTESLMNSYKLTGPLFDQTISMLRSMAKQIQTNGFSLLYTFMIFVTNIFIDLIFGIFGGLLGMSFLNKRNQP